MHHLKQTKEASKVTPSTLKWGSAEKQTTTTVLVSWLLFFQIHLLPVEAEST